MKIRKADYYKNIFINKSFQIRSGWKLAIMLIIYIVTAELMSVFAGDIYSIICNIAGKDCSPILPNAVTSSKWSSASFVLHTVISAAGTIASVFAMWKLTDDKPIKEIGFSGHASGVVNLLKGLFSGTAAMCLTFTILLMSGNIYLAENPASPNISLSLVTGLLVFVCAGFAEEIFSRGYCITVLSQTGNIPVMIIIPSAIFSLLHLGNTNISLPGLMNIFLVGILLSLMFIRTGSLWMPIGFHISWNIFQGSVFGFEVSGITQTGIFSVKNTEENIVNGGSFGPEGGLVVTGIIMAGIILELLFGTAKTSKYDKTINDKTEV